MVEFYEMSTKMGNMSSLIQYSEAMTKLTKEVLNRILRKKNDDETGKSRNFKIRLKIWKRSFLWSDFRHICISYRIQRWDNCLELLNHHNKLDPPQCKLLDCDKTIPKIIMDCVSQVNQILWQKRLEILG